MLLHLGPNVIAFRILLHLGPNVITFRVLLPLGLLYVLMYFRYTLKSAVNKGY